MDIIKYVTDIWKATSQMKAQKFAATTYSKLLS